MTLTYVVPIFLFKLINMFIFQSQWVFKDKSLDT